MAATTITAAIGVGWVLSPIISLIINKVETIIENKYFKEAGIDDEMKKVKTSLRQILSIMGTIEKQRIVDHNKEELIQEIKDAVYETEELMHEFGYRLLKKEKRHQNLISQVASSSYNFVISDPKFKKKIKKVIERLDRAKMSAELLKENCTSHTQQQVRQSSYVTSSLISENIIGREREHKDLINLLFKQEDESPTIIPIVGQGGIGKTTLARMIYNDPIVEKHFERIWVYVSNNLDKDRLTRDMLKQADKNLSPVDGSFQQLHNELKEKLESKSKKILLVLDDVWYHKDSNEQASSFKKEWSEVLAAFNKVKRGSKIILTTRQTSVGNFLGSVKPESLEGLNKDDSWSLFKLCAFDHQNEHNLGELEPIGREILKNLKGSALAIRLVGGQLKGNCDVEDWKRILKDNPLDTSDIMDILYRSYEHLPGQLQHCFAYCSLFPKGYDLKPDRLVHMWKAQGFVLPQEKRSLEEVGRGYFNELLVRSFIQVIKQEKKEYYVMHDHVNELACHVSKGECYKLYEGDSMKNLGSIRHLSVTTPPAFEILRTMHGLDKLRTLLFLDNYVAKEENLNEVLVNLKSIRVLDIRWKITSVPNFGECKYLYYLLFRTYTNELALDLFSKLHYLAVLKIKNGRIGNGMLYLTIPQSIFQMCSMETTDTSKSVIVDVGGLAPEFQKTWRGGSTYLHVKREKGHGLDQFGYIKNIKGFLEIRGLENVTSNEEAYKVQLNNQKDVTKLIMKWSGICCENIKYHEVLETLKPNPNVEVLTIDGYPAPVCPSWLESNLLSRIELIKLCNCNGLEILPALGQLPLLRRLWIESMIAVRRIGLEFYGNGTFPSLEYLVIIKLRRLAEWIRPCDVEVFPKLKKIRIANCPKFVQRNWDGFPALRKFTIALCDAMIMKRKFNVYGCLLTIIKLDIINCKGIVKFEGVCELVSLKSLNIKYCPNLLSLPEMECFYSLRSLAISDCPKLKSLPKKGLPVSLLLLCISGTPLLTDQIRCKKGPEWSKVAAISGCHCFTSGTYAYALP
jgi:DNA replication protein DnaC